MGARNGDNALLRGSLEVHPVPATANQSERRPHSAPKLDSGSTGRHSFVFATSSALLARSSSDLGDDKRLIDLLRSKADSLLNPRSAFSPVLWLFGGNAQTIYTSLCDDPEVDKIKYECTLIRSSDGGTLAIDVVPSASKSLGAAKPVLLVTHGLTGGSHEAYVRAAIKHLTSLRFDCDGAFTIVVLNSRGCNQTPVTSPKLSHAGVTDDIRHAILWISASFPASPIYGLGQLLHCFSMGANALTKYAGEEGDACPLSAIVSVANVWDFVRGNALRNLLSTHREAFKHSSHGAQLSSIFKSRFVTLRQYHDTITSPLYGFAGADDYYAQISSVRYISKIRIPLLGLNAADDPVTGPDTLPVCDAFTNPWIVLAQTDRGGHLGWFERGPGGEICRWFVKPIGEFLGALLDYDLAPRPQIGVEYLGDMICQQGRPDISYVEPARKILRIWNLGTVVDQIPTKMRMYTWISCPRGSASQLCSALESCQTARFSSGPFRGSTGAVGAKENDIAAGLYQPIDVDCDLPTPHPSGTMDTTTPVTTDPQATEERDCRSGDGVPKFEPMSFSMNDIRAAIPTRLFERNTAKSMRYLARDMAMATALWRLALCIDPLLGSNQGISFLGRHVAEALRWLSWALYWWFQGLVFTGIWVIGHECGHGAFSESKIVCDIFGYVLHTLLWTPYFSWRISHHRHHSNHASMERDEVYVPKTRSDLGIPRDVNRPIDYEEYFGDTPLYTLFMLVRQQLLAFPAYLLFNVSGQKSYPPGTNHFDPRSILFTQKQRDVVIASNLGIAAMILGVQWACTRFGATAVLKYYGIPWLCVTHWFIMITYLHHTDPDLPHYRNKEWSYQRGAAATVDRPFLGWQGRFFLHDVAHFHVVHHFFPRMPWYHGAEATQYLRDFIGEHYMFSDKPVFRALWDNYNDCQFVEDEAPVAGDVLFYRDKMGRARRQPAKSL
ncbi:hypothetical protein EVG20_g2522 [Dentipellis fragilis]|uniref:Fatty acid desaturase domain-containing protein n=1 Tax=Dentipellis fragilis TaxID=205917 RepID=A0A4Y9Z8P3_9AGAM|nr:hypothetical protein EVG20_g2522 [Dentipellis fragilis]